MSKLVETSEKLASEDNYYSKSLQDICVEVILSQRKYNTLEGCVYLYYNLDLSSERMRPIHKHVANKFRDFYPYLQENFDMKSLQEAMKDIDWTSMQESYSAMVADKKKMSYMKGTVLERTPPRVTSQDADYYPLEALQEGVAWPKNVDPKNREKYLSDEDFEKTFDMTKDEFYSLPPFKRKILKQESLLF